MKKIDFSLKKNKWKYLALACVLISLLLMRIIQSIAAGISHQNMASRWSKHKDVAQISCFFSREAALSQDNVEEFEYNLNEKLKEASIETDPEKPNARLWLDSYSAFGKVNVSSDKASISDMSAIGIGGDFFDFHPMDLQTGNYFNGKSLNKDCCVIDEDAAWKLFGSNNIIGQMIDINNKPHMIVGVIARPRGKMEEAAGLVSSIIYVSYETLLETNPDAKMNNFEIVMPNPVENFAIMMVREILKPDDLEVEVIENSQRYTLFSCIKRIKDFTTRSMNSRAIIYPYWENIARGYEDILTIIAFFVVILLIYPVIGTIIWLYRKWKYRNWKPKERLEQILGLLGKLFDKIFKKNSVQYASEYDEIEGGENYDEKK